MNISKSTINTLSNFSKINGSVIIPAGNVVRTINESKTCSGRAELEDTFPKEFALYNLHEFLTVLKDLFANQPDDIEFGDESMTIKRDGVVAKYRYTDKSMVMGIEKDPKLPPVTAEFDMTADTLQKLIKSKSILGLDCMIIYVENGKLYASAASDRKGKSNPEKDNQFSVCIGEYEMTGDVDLSEYRLAVKIENFLMPINDYKTRVYIKGNTGILELSTDGLQYIVALDKNNSVFPSE